MRKYLFFGFACASIFLLSACKTDSTPSVTASDPPAETVTTPSPTPTPTQTPEPTPTPDPDPGIPPVTGGGMQVTASGDDGYPAVHTIDGSLSPESRWTAYGKSQWIQYDLGNDYLLKGVNIAFYQSASRVQYFLIELKTSSGNWTKIFSGASRLNDPDFQQFGFMSQKARYIRITNGSANDDWISLVEVAPVLDTEAMFPAANNGATYYVSPNGNDRNSGLTTGDPKKTIQSAIDLAQPGDRVMLSAGRYFEDIDTVRSGTSQQPITIQGPADAIIQGAGEGRVFEITHDYIHVLGFTLDGKVNGGGSAGDYRDKLMYVQGTQHHRGPTGLVIRGMKFLNAGGECLRLRYFIRNADVGHNRFENCGVRDFKFNGGGKNGEAIYLGTSSTQWADGKNPSSDADVSTNNRIHHNWFNTQGNECIDIKEGSINNVVEHNYCTGQLDPNSGGFDSRSDKNIFRYNVAVGNRGAGVRIGGHNVDGHLYGSGNDIYGNVFQDNQGGTIKFMVPGQGRVCENTIEGTVGRSTEGNYHYDPAVSCES